jgi:hypothetical protein
MAATSSEDRSPWISGPIAEVVAAYAHTPAIAVRRPPMVNMRRVTGTQYEFHEFLLIN